MSIQFDKEGIKRHDRSVINRAEWFASLIAKDGTKYRVFRSQNLFNRVRNVDYFITPINSKEVLSRVSIRPALSRVSAKFHSYQTKRGYKKIGFNRILERFLDQELSFSPFEKSPILDTKKNLLKKYEKRGWKIIPPSQNFEMKSMHKKLKPQIWKGAKAIKAKRRRK